jgi:uncharacterized protein (DUF362 family)
VAPSLVSIVRAHAYDQKLYDTVRRILEEHNLNLRGRKVVIKPNLVEFETGSSINTHPVVVHALLEAVRSMDAADVRIAEGPAQRRGTLDLADAAGYFQTIPRFEDVFVDLNLDDITRVRLKRPLSGLEDLYLPNTVLGCDLLISLPKLKTHRWAGVTLSMKNLFGTVPGGIYGWPKNILHWAGIHECVVDLHSSFAKQFALVDGIMGMEGDGPIHGTPKRMDVLVAGADSAAVDATCCRIMGIDPLRIDHLRLAARNRNSQITERAIRQIGDQVDTVRSGFAPPPNLAGVWL